MLRVAILTGLLFFLSTPIAQAAPTGTLSSGVLTITADDDGGFVLVSSRFGEEGLVVSGDQSFSIGGCSDAGGAPTCPGVTAVRFVGGNGDDHLSVSDIAIPVDASGGPGDDYLSGGWGSDTLRGGPGKDEINATQWLITLEPLTDGADTIDGGPDDDRITTRDGTVDTVDCGAGQDHIVADWLFDPMTGCEEPEPQITGDFTYTGQIATGSTATMSTAQAAGLPSPSVTYAWEISSQYFDTIVLTTGQSYTFTAQDIAKGSQYKARIRGCARATNAFGTHERCATESVPPAPVETATTTTTAGGGAPGAPPAIDPLKVAATALRGRLVPVTSLTVRTLAAFRRAGRIKLSTRRSPVPVLALVCGGGLCQVTLTPTLALRGGKQITLAKQRFRIVAGTSAVLTIRLTKAQRVRLKRARRGELRLAGTLRVGGVNTPLAASVAVR